MPEIIYTHDQLETVAATLLQECKDCTIFTLSGTLGAGKTTLVQALLRAYGVTDQILPSPTFAYVNIYHTHSGLTLYHFDCYRIDSVASFIDAGFDEYLYASNSVCFIEWPEVIMPLLHKQVCTIQLEYHGQHARQLTYDIAR